VTDRDRAAVVATGCICALGATVRAVLRELYAGTIQTLDRSAVRSTLDKAPAVFSVTAPLPQLPLPKTLTRTSHLALTAVSEAAGQVGDRLRELPATRIGVCFGTTVGGTLNDEAFYRAFHAGREPEPTAVSVYLANDVATVVADFVGARGPVLTVADACASGGDALGLALAWLRQGECDLVVAGGADELARFAYLGFASMSNSSTRRCRPFDLEREGLNLGEGAGVIVLEREESARRRGAAPLGLLSGCGWGADAYHPTAPHPGGRGLRSAISGALRDADLTVEDIAFVNAHGTGTRENDRIEGQVLADLFPESTPVVSTKGFTGHTLGAAGAIEAVLAVHNLFDGKVPCCAGFVTPDPECRVVPPTAVTEVNGGAALSDSLAFGGTNTALVLERWA